MELLGEISLTDLTSCGGCAAPSDDAAVYRLDEERALVFTLDFFPPIVDDPGDYGAIAATNALNDVFAMGGVPLVALSVASFPEELPAETVGAILAGADARVRKAGAVLAGGYTLRGREPLYGLAAVGTVHPQRIWRKSGARAGDALYLTKALGTGLIVHGWKRTGGDERNREFASRRVSFDGASGERVALAFDPQTAGGLLISIPAERVESLESAFSAAQLSLSRIGTVEAGAGVVLA